MKINETRISNQIMLTRKRKGKKYWYVQCTFTIYIARDTNTHATNQQFEAGRPGRTELFYLFFKTFCVRFFFLLVLLFKNVFLLNTKLGVEY